MTSADNEVAREPYEAPTVEDVPIRAEEQVLAGCKQTQSGGQSPIFCFSCRIPSAS